MTRSTALSRSTLLLAVLTAPGLYAQPALPDRPTSARQSAAAAEQTAPEPDSVARLRGLVARPGGLTADEAARRAAATSPNARAERYAAAQAEAEIDRANVAWYPRLTLSARYARLSPIEAPRIVIPPPINAGIQFPVILNQYALQANVTVPISDYVLRTSQSVAAATRSREAAELQARAAALAAAAQAKLLYYNWARARLAHMVASQSLEQARAHASVVKAIVDAGRASKADFLAAEAEVANAELLEERSHNAAELADDQLRTTLHDPAERRYEIGDDLLSVLAQDTARSSLATLQNEAVQKRLEARAIERAAASVREQRRVARAGGYPRFDAFGNAYYANPNQRYFPQQDEWHATWDVGVQLTWSPNDAGLAAASGSGLEAKQAQLEAQRTALYDGIKTEVTQAHQALHEADVAVSTTTRGLLAAEEAYRARTELYAAGRATSIEVIDAETGVLRARLEHVNARVDQRIARTRLDHALGRDVR